jgi:hypothetical protein
MVARMTGLSPAALAATVADPEWLAHRYDPQGDAFHFVAVPREAQSRAVFLTDEHLPADPPLRAIARAAVHRARPAPVPLHFIFHSAFCCSTLLARALDRPGLAVALKEPVVFNDIVGWRWRGGRGETVAAVLDETLDLLARPFAPGEAVVVKPSNIVAGIAGAMLDMRPRSRAVLLHTTLRDYVGSIARKGLWGRMWVREVLIALLKDGMVDLGIDDYLKLTDLQVAAVGWVAQHAAFARLLGHFGPGRVRSLNSEALVADPARALDALFGLYGWEARRGEIAAILAEGVFDRDAKAGTAFGAAARSSAAREGTETHGDEIDKVVAWAEAVAAQAKVAMMLPHPLIG